ncbi:STAS domain-containing protein [Streptomyces sp. TLI_171]|uniref:STAS domain-containing protein n=1 Tax=Streptomyces sp. TLI_171 TaxID=1938859 RepID=UPI000C508471|nr:STAS domain-containing protein [Streptomyces sp. TLI_171]RKE17679.1 anti-sigma B factor antagonist [Streptomyces sp. TLI_171]
MALSVSYGERYGWTVVQVAGEVDISGVAALRERLQRLVTDGCQQMVVDISRVDFCDSTGFAVLVATRRMLYSRGGRLRLVLPGPETHTRKILQLFGIERIFDVHDSVDDALADLREGVVDRDAVEAVLDRDTAGTVPVRDAAEAVPRQREGKQVVTD